MSNKSEGPTNALMIYALIIFLGVSVLLNKLVCNQGAVVKADKVATTPDKKGH